MNNNVVYGVFDKSPHGDSSTWELCVFMEEQFTGKGEYVSHIRCKDDKFSTLISRKASKLDSLYKNYKIYLDGELVHQTFYR